MGEGAVNAFALPRGDTSLGVNSICEGHKMKKIPVLMLLAFAGFIVVLALSGCSGDGNTSLRATAAALEGNAPATPQPVQVVTMVVGTSQVSEVQQVRVEVPVQVEVTRIVEVVVTATPDIQGFPAPDAAGFVNAPAIAGIDESVQPCPATFWKNGQCTATQAQMDAYAEGGE